MYQTSAEYRTLLKSRSMQAKGYVVLTDITSATDVDIAGTDIEKIEIATTTTPNKRLLGSISVSRVTVSFLGDITASLDITHQYEVKPYLGLVLGSGSAEYVPMQPFIVDKFEYVQSSKKTVIEGTDYTKKFTKDYVRGFDYEDNPTLADVLADVLSQCGVSYDSTGSTLFNSAYAVDDTMPLDNLKCNELLNYILDLGLAFGFVTREGKFRTVKLSTLLPTTSTLTNAVSNGDFDVATDWTGEYGTLTVSNNIANVVGLGTNVLNRLSQTISITANHQYYVKVYAKVCDSDALSLKASIYDGTSEFDVESASTPTDGYWYELNAIVTPTHTSASGKIRIVSEYSTIEDQEDKILNAKTVIVVDLTAKYGAGNEPTASVFEETLSQFDNSWFDGTATICTNADEIIKKAQATQFTTAQDSFKTLGVNTLTLILDNGAEAENVSAEDSSMVATDGAVELTITGNPFIWNETLKTSVVDAMLAEIKGFSYKAFSITSRVGPHLDLGDMMVLNTNIDGSAILTPFFNMNIVMSGVLKVTLGNEAETLAQTQYKQSGKLTERVRRTEIGVDKVNGEISLIVEDVDNLGSDMAGIVVRVDGIESTVSDHTGQISTIQQDVNSITDTITSVDADLQQVKTVFKETSDGFEITKQVSGAKIASIKSGFDGSNAYIKIDDGGSDVATIQSNNMQIANATILNSLTVGQHKITYYNIGSEGSPNYITIVQMIV